MPLPSGLVAREAAPFAFRRVYSRADRIRCCFSASSLARFKFLDHLRRLLVIAQTDKSAMPQVPGVRPLDEGDLADELWFDPSAFLHFLCG
jgi:hypothetical protein